jgi:ribosomal protein S18 acetylase RimI-like enzyme
MIQLITANRSDLSRIQKILDTTPTYSMNMSGRKAIPDAAQKLFEGFPKKKSAEDKLMLIIQSGDIDVGIVDLIHGYPEPDTAFLGLLAIVEKSHRQGLGKAAYLEVETLIKEVGLKKIRLAVVETNPVLPFWEKMGFHPTGEKKDYRNFKVQSASVLMEKTL